MMRSNHRNFTCVVLLTSVLVSCASAPAPAPAPPPTATSEAASKAGELRTDAPPAKALELFPLAASSATLKYLDGNRKGETFATTLERDGDAGWKQVDLGIRTIFLREQAGAIVVTREEDMAENVIIEYDPPLELLPASLKVGEPRQTHSKMVVRNRETGAVRDEGECVHEVRFLGVERRTTAAGAVDVARTQATRRISLKLAKVVVVIDVAAEPKRGLVWSRVQQNTRALGLFSVNKAEEYELVEARKQGAAQD